jgi:hypothetical protein
VRPTRRVAVEGAQHHGALRMPPRSDRIERPDRGSARDLTGHRAADSIGHGDHTGRAKYVVFVMAPAQSRIGPDGRLQDEPFHAPTPYTASAEPAASSRCAGGIGKFWLKTLSGS